MGQIILEDWFSQLDHIISLQFLHFVIFDKLNKFLLFFMRQSTHDNFMQQPTSTEFSEPEEAPRQQPPPEQAAPNANKLNSNFYARTRTTILMLVGFAIILASGQVYSSLLVFCLNVMVFLELSSLKRNEEKQVNIPMTRYINWILFFLVNYYCLGEVLIYKFPILGIWSPTIHWLLTYHKFICFSMSIFTFLYFVLSLKQGYLKYQFRLFGWIVLAIILVSYQSWMLIHNIFEGLFWYIIPSMLIIVNDIFAYIFGYFFGKRQLIALSPKKTWQGYIGGAASTFFFSLILTSALQSIPGLTCAMRQPTIIPFNYPTCEEPLLEVITIPYISLQITNIQAHILVFSLFASIIGPFGGFFASGLKRSIKIKDFANMIPGHGGVSDRMDCQVIMGSFTYFYLHTFLRVGSHILAYWLKTMTVDEKLSLHSELTRQLGGYGLL